MEDKEKKLVEFDRQLQKRKEQMDQLEKSLQKQGGTAAAAGELNKKLTETQRQLEAYALHLPLFDVDFDVSNYSIILPFTELRKHMIKPKKRPPNQPRRLNVYYKSSK